MNKLLCRTISYHDHREDFYHAFLAGIFTGAGYMVESNKEHGEGRNDIVVSDPVNGQAAVFEAKYSRTLGGKTDREAGLPHTRFLPIPAIAPARSNTPVTHVTAAAFPNSSIPTDPESRICADISLVGSHSAAWGIIPIR